MERLGDFLLKHIDGIVAYLRSRRPLRRRRGDQHDYQSRPAPRPGMRDEEMLLLKLKWATAHPIRSARDLVRFLTAQSLHSNR